MLLLLACIETGVQDRVADPDDGVVDTAPQPPGECPEWEAVAPVVQPEACERAPRGHSAPTLQWEVSSFLHKPAAKMVMMAPVASQRRVWFTSFEGRSWYKGGVLRALDGQSGEVVVSVAGSGLEGSSGLAAHDLDGDGQPEILGLSTTGEVIAFAWDGSELWRSEPFASDVGYSANPAVADLDGDGRPEVLAGRAVVSSSGETLAIGALGKGTPGSYGATPVPFDLDGDGQLEVLVGDGAFAIDGSTLWTVDAPDGFVAPGDVDGDGQPEVVVSGNGQLRVQDETGVRWVVDLPGAESTQGGPPTLADLDGDGAMEIAVSAGAALSVFDGQGALLWEAATQDSSTGITGLTAFDLGGDGLPELVLADEVAVSAWDAQGTLLWRYEAHGNWTTVEYPTFADVDGDGQAELMVPRSENPGDPERSYTGLALLQSPDWPRGPTAWPQHATSAGDGSFRAWPAETSPGVDLRASFGAVCQEECGEGRVVLELRVANHGTLPASPTLLELATPSEVLATQEIPALEPGQGWAEILELDAAPTESAAPRLREDPLGCAPVEAEPQGWCEAP